MKTLSMELQLDIQALIVKIANIDTLNATPGRLMELKLEAQALKRRCLKELES